MRYNSLEDDPLIYATVDNQNFALYLKMPRETVRSTYTVDSIDMKYKVIHVQLQVDD
ncbi:hypothetical protein [Flagellimonas sp. 389]|uniref:hypothetical protein n=1 Tax=Flagellimonas sp. 389 TaxID=2835862 RepID=UPI001BD4E3EB|nr:hypothetical protein [Flagellimonas sp. 389]